MASELEPIPADFGAKVGYTLNWSPTYHRENTDSAIFVAGHILGTVFL